MALIPKFKAYFENFVDVLCKSDVDVQVDFGELVEHCGVRDLVETVRDEPSVVLGALSLAVHESLATLATLATATASTSSSSTSPPPKVHRVSLTNYEPLTHLRDLKASLVGPFLLPFVGVLAALNLPRAAWQASLSL